MEAQAGGSQRIRENDSSRRRPRNRNRGRGGDAGVGGGGAQPGAGSTRGRGRGRGGRGRGGGYRGEWSGVGLGARDGSRAGEWGRGGRGHGRNRRGHGAQQPGASGRQKQLSPNQIARLASTSGPSELVDKIKDQLKEFQSAICDVKTPPPMSEVLKILSVLVELASQREGNEQSNASVIIAEILSERSGEFHWHLTRYVSQGVGFTDANVMMLCNLFLSMLRMFQSSACECLPIDDLKQTVERKGDLLNEAMLRKVQDLCETRDEIRMSTNETTESDVVDGEERDDSKFREIPILPDWNEINEDNGTPREVRPNKVVEPYKDWIEYYDIQFRLIREDFIAPLRRGVAAFLQGERGRKNRDVKTYSGARIVSQVTTKGKGICFTVQFDASGFRRHNYNWDQSKRLIFGSLLCFIPVVGHGPANADNIIFATVADRDVKDLQRGLLMVQFEGDFLEAMTHCKNGTEFEIVESNSFFGATSPILRSIQKAEVATMPFSEQLIEGKCEIVPPPSYLKTKSKEIPVIYNLSCLYGPLKKRKNKPPLMIEVLNETSWEAAKNSELDLSQLHAIQIALTQEISVIQGPPGTGKTYIGLKIVEGLLENRHIWDPRKSQPIFVMCFTNHALDQFLEGIIDTECCGRKLEVIRVGGRCKNERVEAFNLNKIRRIGPRRRFGFTAEISQLRREIEDCNPEKAWRDMNTFHHRKSLMPLFILKYIIHPYHFYQLAQMPKCPDQQGKEVEVWLGLWEEKLIIKKRKKQSPKKKTTEQEQPVQFPKRFTEEQVSTNPTEPSLSCETEAPRDAPETEGPREVPENDQGEEKQSQNDEEELITVKGEATLAQEDRMDQDDVEGFQRVELPEEEKEIVEESPAIPENIEDSSSDESDQDNEKESTAEAQNESSNEQVSSYWYRKQDADKTIRSKLFKKDLIMDSDEVQEPSNANISSLAIPDRWRLYNYWAEQRFKYLQEVNREKCQQYSEKCKRLAELRQLEDRHILERADVIGMTTTGAAKNQHILQLIKPKIVIVEEAAEVLEAHIVSALSAGTQHLILIGDHKQLRPKPNEYVLATKYNLRISLFERLVQKNMSKATLEIQHRMRPEIARLVCPHIYDKLVNHESVEKYPNVRGILKNLFFVCHTEPESENQGLMSYQNEFEAKYIVGLCAHLLRVGYNPSQITILTPYVGQLLLLRNKMPKSRFNGVHITAIDNFQGEENDIILFSMVRSGKTTIGFVKEDNRVCVSLSRAKHGFYAIGNFELIRSHSLLWDSIIKDVEERKCFSKALPLYCCNHPETQFSAKKDTDFQENAPNGGCKKMCDIRLPCGHACTQRCHVTDTEHANFQCKKPCERTCPSGHPCKSKHFCCTKCKPCREVVTRVMPGCGHSQEMECRIDVQDHSCIEIVTKLMPLCGHKQEMYCSTRPSSILCQSPCSRKCSNGHPCQKTCFEDCGLCPIEVEKVMPGCNHKQMVPCGIPAESFKCQDICSKPCLNGLHLCKKKCSEECGNCKVLVSKKLPVCGHMQNVKCYKEPDPSKCKHECEKTCPNGQHIIRKMCHEEWPECTATLIRKLPQCGHESIVKCFKDLSTILCFKSCEKKCLAGHRCLKVCHQPCAPCPEKVVKTLPCGHRHAISCSETSTYKCPVKCLKSGCKNGHQCQGVCHYPLPCKPCTEMVVVMMPRCLHKQKVRCFESSKPLTSCKYPCEKKFACGHVCQNKCGETCQKVCTINVTEKLACGHNAMVKCQSQFPPPLCKEIVSVKIECGHTVKTKCYKRILKSLLKKECTEKCKLPLKCGHACQDLCGKPCTEQCRVMVKKRRSCGHEVEVQCYLSPYSPCTKKCRRKLPCGHACKNECGEPCSTCNLKSKFKYPCGHSAKIPCISTIKKHPCTKKCGVVLSCGHCCTGRCGDCSSRRMHAVCIFDIELRRFCGHSVTLPCAGLSNSCDKPHTVPCAHRKDSSQCHEFCGWKCKHYECGGTCGEECDRPLCNKPCDKQLRCGHTCPGLCGERCMSYCHQCNPKKFMEQFHPKPKKGRVSQNPPFFELGCGHMFTVNYLDDQIHNPDRAVGPKQCPKCHQNIVVGSRYGDSVRRAVTDIINISDVERDMQQGVPDRYIYGYNFSVISTNRYNPHNGLSKLSSITPGCKEKNSLIEHVQSADALFNGLRLNQDMLDTQSSYLKGLVDYLVNSATREPKSDQGYMSYRDQATYLVPVRTQSQQLHLTFQLLDDFKSELYRLSLRAQCLIAHSQSPPSLLFHMTSRLTGSRSGSSATIIARVEEYLDNLNPLKDRISKEKYLQYSEQIKAIAPNVASLHIVPPENPPVVKGTWKKCRYGHYFCIPPKCGTDSKVLAVRCPQCP